jgi:uncharacterized protein
MDDHRVKGGVSKAEEVACDSASSSPVAGQTAWILSDGVVGHLAITLGVAEALGLQYEIKPVPTHGLLPLLSPWAPVNPLSGFGRPPHPFSPPWPAFAFSAGRFTAPYIRAVRQASGRRTFTVAFQNPLTGRGAADLIWTPSHDRLRGDNVINTLTAPPRYGVEQLAGLRREAPPEIAALPRPRIAVLLGGPNDRYKFTAATIARFGRALGALAAQSPGAGFMVTPSRRSPPALAAAAEEAARDFPSLIWRGEGANPYPQFLAHADLLVVTGDSVNMTGGACATGKPVYVFHPDGGSAKFWRFHEALVNYGATRPLLEQGDNAPLWRYEPLDAGKTVCVEIVRRWLERVHAPASFAT